MDNSSNSSNSSGDEGHTMGRHHTNRPRLPKRVELDLSAAMNMEQKFQLQRLANAIVDDMQNQVSETFDNLGPGLVAPDQGINPPKAVCTTIPNPRSEKYRQLYGDIDLENEDGEPTGQADTAAAKAPKPRWKPPKSPEDALEMYKGSETEVLISSVSELKRDALTHFGKWRVNVLRRIQDIIIKNGGTGGNVSGRAPLTPGNERRTGNAARGRPSAPSGLNTSTADCSTVLARLYPPIYTPLRECPKEKRALILHSMLLILLGLEQYALYSRILLVKLASSLNIPTWVLFQDEVRVSGALSKIIENIPPAEIAQKRAEETKTNRRLKSGGSNTANGGTTGTLAPPLVAAGIGTVFGGFGLEESATASLLGPMAESTVVVGTLFGLYGTRQGTRTMDAYAKDIQDFGLSPLHESDESELIDPKELPSECRRMRVTIGISGLLMGEDDFTDSWQVLGQQTETYALRWELEALTKMGASLETLMKSSTWNEARKEIGSINVFDRLKASLWPTSLVKISKVIENPWCVAMVRAEKAGVALADILISRVYGERPVSLVGYSLGARIIYSCLMTLAEKRAFGLVENVVMIGAPCPSEVRVWAAMRSVVAGRLINAYSKNDYILGFLYRSSTWQFGIAGLQAIHGVPNVENFDASDVVTSHLRYLFLIGSILKKVGWEDIDLAQVVKQQQKLAEQINQEKDLERGPDERSNAKLNGYVQGGKKGARPGGAHATMKMRGAKPDSK
ncbi:hypothetical protein AAE478_005549 [Parahypoxylon ruwenzoriense]